MTSNYVYHMSEDSRPSAQGEGSTAASAASSKVPLCYQRQPLGSPLRPLGGSSVPTKASLSGTWTVRVAVALPLPLPAEARRFASRPIPWLLPNCFMLHVFTLDLSSQARVHLCLSRPRCLLLLPSHTFSQIQGPGHQGCCWCLPLSPPLKRSLACPGCTVTLLLCVSCHFITSLSSQFTV